MHEGSEEGEEKMGLRGRTKCSACFSKAKSDRTLSRATLGSRIPSRQKITTCPQKRIKKGGHWLEKRKAWVEVKWAVRSHFWHLPRKPWLLGERCSGTVVVVLSTSTGAGASLFPDPGRKTQQCFDSTHVPPLSTDWDNDGIFWLLWSFGRAWNIAPV